MHADALERRQLLRMRALSTVGLLVACFACSAEQAADKAAAYDGPPIPWAYAPLGISEGPPDNKTTPEKQALGRMLFYDPILSRDGLTACATCHSEIWGLSDGLALSVGVDGIGPTGPGRTGPNMTTRNAPTLWNVALVEELFWDGREPTLESQALRPLENTGELNKDPQQAAADLGAIPEYRTLFSAAFPQVADPVTPDNIARALAAFQRSFVADRTPYDQYVSGDPGALSDAALRGMELFAEAGCAACHTAPRFDSAKYAARGIDSDDLGRFQVSGKEGDRGAFRVPTLRNARDTEPYFHDGSVLLLRDAVAYEVKLQQDAGLSRVLSEAEVDAIVTFIDKGLTDRSREPHRPKNVPSGLPVPEDGFRIPR